MKIGIHDADQEHLRSANKYPNYALMKISAYHKHRGDEAEWWSPIEDYDLVYSSKIFDFTPENDYLPENTIKGGTGYGIFEDLPKEIDDMSSQLACGKTLYLCAMSSVVLSYLPSADIAPEIEGQYCERVTTRL